MTPPRYRSMPRAAAAGNLKGEILISLLKGGKIPEVSPPTHHCVPCGTPPTQPNMLDSLFCIYSTFFNIQQCLGEARGSRAFFFYAKTAARAVKTASSAVSEERRVVPNARPGVVSERTANAVSERAANVVSERAADAVSERAANVVSERAANAVSERAAKSAKNLRGGPFFCL